MERQRTTPMEYIQLPRACLAHGFRRLGRWLSFTRGRRLALVEEQDGVSAVEFAFVLPVILVLITGIINVGVLMLTQSDMVRVAQDAARALALAQMTEQETKTYVQDKLGRLGENLDVAVTLPDPDAGETDVAVTISVPMADVVPIDIIGMKNLNIFKKGALQTQITMRQENTQ